MANLKDILPERIVVILLIIALGFAPNALAYSYAEKEDPAVMVFKQAVRAARGDNWGEIQSLADKGITIMRGHIFNADLLVSIFEKSIKEKNMSDTAETFAHLVYISILNKLYANIRDKLKKYKTGKSRLFMARKSYMDVLDGNVKKTDPARSVAILKQFDVALGSLGSPGIFGVGKKEPDMDKYKEAINSIETAIETTFPRFKQ